MWNGLATVRMELPDGDCAVCDVWGREKCWGRAPRRRGWSGRHSEDIHPPAGPALQGSGGGDTVRMSAGKETVMPVYISLVKWTDQGRAKASSVPDRVAEVDKRIEALGGRSIGNWLLMVVAERGNAITETLRAFTMDELRSLLA